MRSVDLATADGVLRTALFRPDADPPWPAVLFCMDGIGVRPTLYAMAQRLADHGFVVALPDLFYRVGPYDPDAMRAMVMNPVTRAQWKATWYDSAVDDAHLRMDIGAVLEFLANDRDVVQPKVGTTGYCMGGNISLRVAGLFPSRVAAAASFHGGQLATDAPDSPHRHATRMNARVFVAGADHDPSFPPEMRQRLADAFTAANVDHVVQIWSGSQHGFAVPDSAAFSREHAERHWTVLFALMDAVLRDRPLR
jgi:carboxymethylenebutenolidase